jgi:hypothetical protein
VRERFESRRSAGGRGRTKARGRDAKVWQYQKGAPPHTVTAYERIDRNRVVEVRWWVGSLKRFKRLSLGSSIRDERGMIVEELEQEAVRKTQAIYDELMVGRYPEAALEAPAGEEEKGPLTLAAGFEVATAVPMGMYVIETEHLRDVRRAARNILWAIGTAEIGQPRTLHVLTYSRVRELWLRLARRYVETGQGGPSCTEGYIVILLQVSQWLAVEEKIDRAVAVRRTWREQMRREWEQLTGTHINSDAPRHSEKEIRRIFAALDRLAHNGYQVVMEGPSYRSRQRPGQHPVPETKTRKR